MVFEIRRISFALFLCLFAQVLCPGNGFAQVTIIVPDHYSSIQAAINISSAGDIILVRPGYYMEYNITFAGKAVTVKSLEGPESTFIDSSSGPANGRNAFRFVNGEGHDSVIDGFTITGGLLVGLGGGIYVSNSSPTIRNNIITGNVSSHGAGIGIVGNSTAKIVNNLIYDNRAGLRGGGLCFSSNNSTEVEVINNTIVNNWSNSPGYSHATGGIYVYNSSPRMRNNIIWGNYMRDEDHNLTINNMSVAGTGVPIISYTNFQGGIPGVGNMSADSAFVDELNNDYHLKDYVSPCIDRGDPSDSFSAEPYFNGNRINIGAYGGTSEAARTARRGGGRKFIFEEAH